MAGNAAQFDTCNTADMSFVAGADLSNSQFYAMIMTDDHQVTVAGAAAAMIVGVLQNTPLQGEVANVRTVKGTTSKGTSGAAIALTNGSCALKTDANGKFIPQGGAGAIVAYALKSADAADEQVEILLV